MKNWLFAITLLFTGLWGVTSAALDIQYPGDRGFFIGKPMAYMITADSNGENIGQEGIFTFGKGRVTIDGTRYYDCIFESPSGESHFYLDIDPVRENLMQKGFKVGTTELTVAPAVKAVVYPLSSGDSWSEKVDMTAKDLEIPGLGRFPIPISMKGVGVETDVSFKFISVPAGDFDTLFVESTYNGSLLGIPVTFVQRTWLSEDNVAVKRNFEFVKPSSIMLYEIELSKLTLTPWDVNWDGLVNLVDMVMVARRFNERIDRPGIPNPDVNGDGIVDIYDLVKVAAYFGKDQGTGAPAKSAQADLSPADLWVLKDVYQEALQQSDGISGDDLVGVEKLFHVLDSILAGYPPGPVLKNALFQSYPNPCNPEVWIPYALASNSTVTIGIYNASGQLVRELALGYRPAGIHVSEEKAAHWDGRDSDGERVASGLYFYTIRAGQFAATRRMLVLK